MSMNFSGNNYFGPYVRYSQLKRKNMEEAMSSVNFQYGNPQIQQNQFNSDVNNKSLWEIQRGPQQPGDPNPIGNNSQSLETAKNSQNQENFLGQS